MKAQSEAHGKGYSQVLWLDGVEKKYVSEIGEISMYVNKTLTDIQWGRAKGPEGWSVEIGHE